MFRFETAVKGQPIEMGCELTPGGVYMRLLSNAEPVYMKPSTTTKMLANDLIHHHGEGAEEYASEQLQDCQQKKDKHGAARWRETLQALKEVRKLRAKIQRES